MKKGNILLMLGTIGIISFATAAQAGIFSTSAQDFVTKASIAGQFEIQSSKLAVQKSQNDDVKDFAQRMIDDHTAADDQLKNAVASSNTNLQISEDLDSKHQKLIAKLNSLTGVDFDKKYVSLQIKAHEKAVHLFRGYAKQNDAPALNTFAKKTLPTLQDHLTHAKQLKDTMGGK